MKFKLIEFGIHQVDEKAHLRFVANKDGEQIVHDEMLRYENEEDTSLLLAIEAFVNAKEDKK